MEKTVSVQKLAKFIALKSDLEKKLKASYSNNIQTAEVKAVQAIKEDPGKFFSYAKARQKTHSKIWPFVNSETGVLENDPDYSAKILSDQYSSVFSKPRPEWEIHITTH